MAKAKRGERSEKTVLINARVTPEFKKHSQLLAQYMGMSLSDLIQNGILRISAEQALSARTWIEQEEELRKVVSEHGSDILRAFNEQLLKDAPHDKEAREFTTYYFARLNRSTRAIMDLGIFEGIRRRLEEEFATGMDEMED